MTPAQDSLPKVGMTSSDPLRVPVSGKEVLNFFSFGTTHEVMMYDVTILLGIMTAYLTLAFILLKISQRDAMY